MPRSDALIRAQEKYLNKILSNPDLKKQYYDKMKEYNKKHRDIIKSTPSLYEEHKRINRENARKYYYDNLEKMREKNRNNYHIRKNKNIMTTPPQVA
jgi:hypothetical protein